MITLTVKKAWRSFGIHDFRRFSLTTAQNHEQFSKNNVPAWFDDRSLDAYRWTARRTRRGRDLFCPRRDNELRQLLVFGSDSAPHLRRTTAGCEQRAGTLFDCK